MVESSCRGAARRLLLLADEQEELKCDRGELILIAWIGVPDDVFDGEVSLKQDW